MDFIYWIQPNLIHKYVNQDTYVYIKNDDAENIYFQHLGAAGFVHLNPNNHNIIFVDLGEGDNYGQLELYFQCVIEDKSYQDVLNDERENHHYFTVQALTDCEIFSLSIKNLGRMIAEFPDAFKLIFANE